MTVKRLSQTAVWKIIYWNYNKSHLLRSKQMLKLYCNWAYLVGQIFMDIKKFTLAQ